MQENRTNSEENQGQREQTSGVERKRSNRGFAAMSPERQREIASKGGRAAHEQGVAHQWNSDEARQAGRKGGMNSRGGRRNSSENKGQSAPEI
jgi:general stress protein YciG